MKILWLTSVAIASLLLAGILAIQTPQVQTYLSEKILDRLSGSIDADISFEKIHFKPFNTVILKNAVIADKAPEAGARDTLFKAGYVIARFTLKGLKAKEGLHIGRAYVRDAEMNLVIEEQQTNLERIFGIKKKQEPRKEQGNVFDIRRAYIDNMVFRMQNLRSDTLGRKGNGIDWKDLEITDINIEARHLKLSERVMSGTLDEMSFREKSGYICTSISGKTAVGNGECRITGLKIRDPWSDVSLPLFSMSYGSAQDFKDFINKVSLKADIEKSILDSRTLSYFTPVFDRLALSTIISGAAIDGPISDLGIGNINAEIPELGAILTAEGRISGLPDARRMTSDLLVEQLSLTSESIEKLLNMVSPGKKADISRYAPGQTLTFKGRLKGRISSLKVGGSLKSDIGDIYAMLDISGIGNKGKGTGIQGNIKTRDLDIGKIIGNDLIHECSINSGVKATLGKNGPRLEIDSLIVSRLNVNRYDYSNIAATGTVAQNEFDGRIICNDPNLNFLFQGIFTISPKTMNSLYRFYANVGYADLNAMNIDRRGMSKIRFQTSANFNRISKGDMLGNIDIGNIVLENEDGKYEIGDIRVSSHSSERLYRMNISSDFADGSFTGSGSIAEFARDIKEVTLKRELSAMFEDSTYRWHGKKYSLALKLYDTMDLLAFAFPGLYIADGTSLNVGIDTSGTMSGRMTSQRIAFNEQYLKDLTFRFDNTDGSLKGEMKSDNISIATLNLKNSTLRLFAEDNHIGLGYTYDNQGNLQNRGELYLLSDMARLENGKLGYHVSLLPSSIYLNSREWSIMPSELSVTGNGLDVSNIEFRSGEQRIRLHGQMPDTGKDTLHLEMDRFDISIANPVLGKNAEIAGAATGKAMLVSDGEDKSLLLDYICDSTSISGSLLGTVRLGSNWDEQSKKFFVSLYNSLNGKKSFDINGWYEPRSSSIDVSAEMDRFDIACALPVINSVFSEAGGHLSGGFRASGKLSDIRIESTDARFDDASLRIAFTNVPYKVNGGFHLDSHGIYFDNIILHDRYGNPGYVTGEISHNHFRNIQFDTRIDVERIECVDLGEKSGGPFYGNLFATAGINISGPVNAIRMNIDATTTGRGDLHIPISSSGSSSASNLLTFKKIEEEVKIDPYEAMISRIKTKEKSRSDFAVKLRVAATPGVEAFVEIDKASGNVLSGYGSGNIDLEVRPSRDIFNISGDYTLSGGNYKFVAIGFAKDFSIREGSSVRFNGDVMESTLNIDAIYKTKTALGTLIADTTSVNSRRTVECGIRITDRISNPRLQFSINVPDIDPAVKSRVESALSTEDKVQKQFLSLLMSNSFLPDEQSGIVNNSSFLTSSVSEIMSNQLNNIFQKLDIPLDLGLNYQPNEKGNDIFDVAVSTQLFNNRVIVNGNIGNRQYTSGTSTNEVVGDLDIEVKLDRPGAFRLSLFSHSADQYSNYLDNSQRNGIGLAYQQEFNSFKEFFKNLFAGRKKREEMQRAAEKAMLNEEKVRIKIKAEEK